MFCKFRSILLLSLSLVILSGCDSSPQSKLIGTWEVEMSEAVNAMTEKFGDDPAGQMAAQFAKTMSASNSITTEFRADGKVVLNMSVFGQARKEEGEWTYERMEGDEIVIVIKTSNNTTETTYVKFLPDGTIRTRSKILEGTPTTMTLKRVK